MGSEISKRYHPSGLSFVAAASEALTTKGCRRAVFLGDVADPEKDL